MTTAETKHVIMGVAGETLSAGDCLQWSKNTGLLVRAVAGNGPIVGVAGERIYERSYVLNTGGVWKSCHQRDHR